VEIAYVQNDEQYVITKKQFVDMGD